MDDQVKTVNANANNNAKYFSQHEENHQKDITESKAQTSSSELEYFTE